MKQDRFLTGILIGIAVLVVAALTLYFMRRQQAVYQPEDNPAGVVHNFVLALHNGEYERARETLRALADRAESLEGSYVVIFSHYQLGRVHQLAGRPDEARAAFDLVLTMPDQHGAHDLSRKALTALPAD